MGDDSTAVGARSSRSLYAWAVSRERIWMGRIYRHAVCLTVLAIGIALFPANRALAVPSFARQLGVDCSTCHTVFPELTPFGRDFKRHGYTAAASTSEQNAPAGLLPIGPISAMMQSSYTHLDQALPKTQNDNFTLFDQWSFFYAGRVAKPMGAFVQLTYEGASDHFSLDNTDVRVVGGAPLGAPGVVYGLTVNNNPTVQDLWNSTPAWGYPYASSPVAPTPSAATQVDLTLAQQVAGLGGYLSAFSWLDAELTLYRSFQLGAPLPPNSSSTNVIHALSPYWRLAAFHQFGDHSFEVGTYGLWTRQYPGGGTPLQGPTNGFVDVAEDVQYQWITDRHIVTAHATCIWEGQDLDASVASGAASQSAQHLVTFRANATYYWTRMVGGTAAFFNTSGSRDAAIYAPGSVTGSRTGSPNSTGLIFELNLVPWQNVKLAAQYTVYTRFNGSRDNYDGSGRSASANNTLYLNAWANF